MPMVMRYVQGSKCMVLVPKENTRVLHFKDFDKNPLQTKLYGYVVNNANGPRDHGKRGVRMAKRKSRTDKKG